MRLMDNSRTEDYRLRLVLSGRKVVSENLTDVGRSVWDRIGKGEVELRRQV